MQNWTDKIIHWHQLPGTELRRLIDTWGMTDRQIVNYDAKHGFVQTPIKAHATNTSDPVDFPKTTAPAKKVKATAKVKAQPKPAGRQKHTGADGEIKFVEHRNLYVGFYGGRVVVTKRTAEACRAFLQENFAVESAKTVA